MLGVGIGVGLQHLRGADAGVLVPIALTASDGTVFTDADGNVLTYGTKRVRPITDYCANWIMKSGYWDNDGVWANRCTWTNEVA